MRIDNRRKFVGILKTTAATILVCISLSVEAAERWYTSTIDAVYPMNNSTFAVVLSVPTSYCSNSNNYHYVAVGQNGVTAEGSKMMYAAVLAAQAAGKRISIAYDDSTGDCLINRLKIHTD